MHRGPTLRGHILSNYSNFLNEWKDYTEQTYKWRDMQSTPISTYDILDRCTASALFGPSNTEEAILFDFQFNDPCWDHKQLLV